MADTETTDEKKATKVYHGRHRVLMAPVPVTSENVVKLIDRARMVHSVNSQDERYLHEYFLGHQPVLKREKATRPEINNAVVENRAYQFVKDRTDSLAGEPITYTARGIGRKQDVSSSNQDTSNSLAIPRSDDDDDGISDKVQRLNDCCIACDKHASDLELVQWMMEVGVGYRLILPTREVAEPSGDQAEKPFMVATLDPRSTCVVYSNDVFHQPLFAYNEVVDPLTASKTQTLYTDTQRFVVVDGKVTEVGSNPLGMIPIIEYQANPERMGIFEAVLSLFDAINEVESNRVDGIAQFVQSLMVLTNVDIDEDEYKRMLKLGAVKIDSQGELPAKVELLTAELNQEQTQTLVDNFYKTALSICGMPFNVGGSASTSDTGAAVTMRDGWSNSESRCKETEAMFKRSERKFLDAALHILDVSEHLGLKSSSVDVKFTRRNYEAVQSKAQVLTTLLGSNKVHPRLAFQASDLFSDTEDAYDQSMQYAQEQAQASLELFQQRQAASDDGQNSGGTNKPADDDNGNGASDNGSKQGGSDPR